MMSGHSEEKTAPRERRETYRCQLGDSRRRGRLKWNEREFATDVLDESAGGFAILIQGPAPCEIGQSMWLELESHGIEVRLVNSQPYEDATLRSPGESKSEVFTRLGLMRLNELPAEMKRESIFSWRAFTGLLASLKIFGRLVARALILALLAFSVGVGVNSALENWPPLPQDRSDSGKGKKLEDTAKSVLGDSESSVEAKDPPPLPADRPTSKPKRAEKSWEGVKRSFSRDILSQPKMIRRLNLSDRQLDELRQIDDETSATSAVNAREGSGGTVAEEVDETQQSANLSRRLLKVLTPQQQRLLDQEMSNYSSGLSGGEGDGVQSQRASRPAAGH
jgi:hypothetical protein